MKTIRIDSTQKYDLPQSVCALGFFDGIHRGHQQLIQAAIDDAKEQGRKSAVLTFDPDPWKVLKPDAELTHLSALDDKAAILNAMGVDLFYVVEFTRDFAGFSIDDFHAFLSGLNITGIVCGFDYTYGKKGIGNTQTLAAAKEFSLRVIDQISDDLAKISSSRIEALLGEGDVAKANELLGYMYSIKGVIEPGFQRGRQIGFPTANLDFSSEEVCPAHGVYAGYVYVDGQYRGAMINIGKNPTFNNTKRTIEAYIFDFEGDLYDHAARFFFAKRLRGEIRFSSVDDLKKQLTKDVDSSREALKEHEAEFETTKRLWSLAGSVC